KQTGGPPMARRLKQAGWLALLALGLAAGPRAARPDEPAKKPGDAERARLAQEAAELSGRAVALHREGRYLEATELLRKALALRQRLYPKDQYPAGHPDLARSLVNLGVLLRAHGEYGEALGYLTRALEMYQKLYPKERYPHGHPDLATTLNNL